MLQSSTIVVLPFLAAILTFLGIVYVREKAIVAGSRNFVLAVVSMVTLVSYLALRVMAMVTSTVTALYAVAGVLLFAYALVSTRL